MDHIDFRSDTVSWPTPAMREVMAGAQVGDDVYGEDPTVNALEARVAAMLGHEAGLFVPTGSLGNQLGVRLLAPAGAELLCDRLAHVVRAELGAHAVLGGVTTRTWEAPGGRLDPATVIAMAAPDAGPYLVSTAAVAVEDTHNFGGGSVWPIEVYEDVCAATDDSSPWARSRMSDAFLDAPQHLMRWRSTALAACALLAVGAGLFAGGRLGFDDEGTGTTLERIDRRDQILQRFDAAGVLPPRSRRARGTGTLVSDPGAEDFSPNRRRGSRSGLFLWYGPAREPAEAQRRLDAVGVQIFPVGAPIDGVEQT